ncbi:MAG: hypothetical protein PHQ66_02450 [Candidatus Nanoarchaeia archaeon]|nr:hypothetical protein [Candidatus Nanoarchaeia archaeon]MDD5357772.1 hypothetical protein [Candidatus Nanoarchaeia archaeon]MDD5588691.1 hypothetical protein [Candidatus Nanoarchaeia archaeon]
MAKRGMKLSMHKFKGIAMIVLGLLVIGNVYWQVVDWGTFIGVVIALTGAMKLFMKHKM